MKFNPDSKLYAVIITLGLFLVIVTIVLQAAVLASRPSSSENLGFMASLRRQLASAIEPGGGPTTLGQGAAEAAVQPATATSTPFVIVIPATQVAAATSTDTPPPPMDTATPMPTLPPATDTPAPTETPPPPPPTDTAVPSEPEATSTVAPEAPVAPEAEIRMAYVSRRVDCTNATKIVEQMLLTRLQMTVQVTLFDSPTQMFDALADGSADVTLCYLDPDDRALMRDRLGLIRQIGVQHDVGPDYKLQIWSNGAFKAKLRDDRPCVLDFLEKLDFTGLEPASQDPQMWIQNHPSELSAWLNCSL